MASRIHQLIAGLVVRKMRTKGYEIISFDGNESLITNISLKAPPTIKRHRPDVIGINVTNRRICIGEAKTTSDLNSTRTKEQLLDYATLLTKSRRNCELIIGIPKSAEKKLRKLLEELNLANMSNVSYVWMPDEFLGGKNEI